MSYEKRTDTERAAPEGEGERVYPERVTAVAGRGEREELPSVVQIGGSEGATPGQHGTSEEELVPLTHKRTPMTKKAYFKSLAAKRKVHPFTRKVANGVYLY